MPRDLSLIDATLPQLEVLSKPSRSDIERAKIKWRKQAPSELAGLIDAELYQPKQPQS